MTTRSSRRSDARRVVGLVVLAAMLSTGVAYADPSAVDVETARSLYVEGKRLRLDGDIDGALKKLRAAYALVPTPITALELGRTYAAMAKIVEAREVLSLAARMPVRGDESEKAAAARIEAAELADRLKTRLAAIALELSPHPASELHVAIDDVVVPREAIAEPRKVNPGKHVIVAKLDSSQAEVEVDVVEGETKIVPIHLARGMSSSSPTDTREKRGNTLFVAGLITAGAGLAVGTAAGIVTLTSSSGLKSDCVDGRCPPPAHDDLDRANTAGTISTIAFAVAGAGAAMTVIGLALGVGSNGDKRAGVAQPARGLRLDLGLGAVGARGTF